MPASPRLEIEVIAGAAFELLIGLSAATTPRPEAPETWVSPPARWPRELHAAIAAVGARSGEAWLHLVGLALERPGIDARAFVDEVARVPEDELRRHLVGVYVPAWVAMAGADTLERAAAGKRTAIDELLTHPRYYAGHARDALAPLLAVPASETKTLVVSALRLFADEALAPVEEAVVAPLRAEAESARKLAPELAPDELIARLTEGYAYEPEPELSRVVLVPHVALRPFLLLLQHGESRVICYPLPRAGLDTEEALAERVVAIGRALGDETRVRILRRLAQGSASLDEIADAVAVARSTAHHHLAQLRGAGLVTLQGNARGYTYLLRPGGLDEARRVLGELARAPGTPLAPRSGRRRSAGRPRKQR